MGETYDRELAESSRSKAKSRRNCQSVAGDYFAPGKGPNRRAADQRLAAYDLYLQAEELVDSYTKHPIQRPHS